MAVSCTVIERINNVEVVRWKGKVVFWWIFLSLSALEVSYNMAMSGDANFVKIPFPFMYDTHSDHRIFLNNNVCNIDA